MNILHINQSDISGGAAIAISYLTYFLSRIKFVISSN